MKWILYTMLFVTSASTLPDAELRDHELFEKKHIWTLQSSTTMELSTLDSCWAAQDVLVDAVFPVGNMTVRAWCMCDDPNNKCPTNDDIKKRISELERQKKNSKQTTLVELPLSPQAARRFNLQLQARQKQIEKLLILPEAAPSSSPPSTAAETQTRSYSIQRMFTPPP